MASSFSTTAKNAMLDALTLNGVRLHSGDPGATGTGNALGAGISAATFAAASNGERALSTQVDVTGLAASQSVTWYSVWTVAGSIFQGRGQITAGDVTANAAGEYSLTTACKVTITDPP